MMTTTSTTLISWERKAKKEKNEEETKTNFLHDKNKNQDSLSAFNSKRGIINSPGDDNWQIIAYRLYHYSFDVWTNSHN